MKARICLVWLVRRFLIPMTLLVATDLSAETEKDSGLPVFAINAEAGFPGMLALAGRRSAYLLGDASHGTEEYYAFRRMVTEHLIRQHGVRSVIIEEEWDSLELLNDYVSSTRSDSIASQIVMDAAFPRWPGWLWNNRQMSIFIDWVREFNRNRSANDQVKLLGMDMKEAVLPALARLGHQHSDSDDVARELEMLKSLWPLVVNPEKGGVHDFSELKLAHDQIDQSISRLGKLVSNSSLLELLQYANHYHQQNRINGYKAWNIRSEFMARFVERAIAGSENPVVVWAHNNHVGDKSADDVKGTGLINMGYLLRQYLGPDQIFILGSASNSGKVVAARQWLGQQEVQNVLPARKNSIEWLLNQQEWDNPLLYWHDRNTRTQWNFDVLHRGVGVKFDSRQNDADTWVITSISRRYDALVFWKNTTALQ